MYNRQTYRISGTGSRQPDYPGVNSQYRRRAWENDSDYGTSNRKQYTDGQSSATTANSDHESSGLRSPSAGEHYQMDVDEPPASSEEMMPLTKTTELFSTLQRLQTLATESKKEIRVMKQSVSNKSSDDVSELSAELEKLKVENQKLEARCTELSRNRSEGDKIIRLEEELKRVKDSKEVYKKKYNDMALQYKTENDRTKELEETVSKQKTENENICTQWVSVNTQLTRKQALYEKTEEEKKQFERELSECKTRLSRLMGNKLANNNPDIADLSDKNRPTKLAEKNQELYDNQWTDAFEVFEKHFDNERKSIQVLLQMLKDIKMHCNKLTKDQEQKLHEVVILKRTRDNSLPDLLSKQLKDFRKSIAEASYPEVLEKCLSGVSYKDYATLLKDERVQSFFKECVELCWLMSVQDPPLVFGEAPKSMDAFDTNTYKFYTKTGQYIDYIVWPALVLHRGGPLLSKGIAQAYGKEQSMSDKQRAGEPPLTDKARQYSSQRVESEPQGQNIERHMPRKEQNQDKEYESTSSSSQWQNVQSQNYEQSIVRSKNATAFETEVPSRTTRERASNADVISKTKYVSDGRIPPESHLWTQFKDVVRLYGIDSPEVKDRFGENYNKCAEYYIHIFGNYRQ